MTKCICIDTHKKSREAIKRMIKKINGLMLVRTFASIDAAVNIWKETNIDIVFINLYNFPVPEKDITLLNKMAENGTQIIILSSKMKIVFNAISFKAADFILLPTSARRICKASAKALKIIDPCTDEPKIKLERLLTKNNN